MLASPIREITAGDMIEARITKMKDTKKRKLGKTPHGKHQSHDRRKPKATNPSVRKAVEKAPAPAPTDQLAAPSYNVSWFGINAIKVDSANRRPVIPNMVKTLVHSIPKEGLRIPLIVRLLNGVAHLVAGLQRLEALKILGWEEVPCIRIDGDENIARRVQIIENAHRAELTKMEKANQTKEWLKLTESLDRISGEKLHKKPGRPEGGDAKAARTLPIPGKSVDAKRKKIASDRKIAALDPAVKKAIVKAGLDDDTGKLKEIADQKTPEAALAKVREFASPRKPEAKTSGDSSQAEETHFERMARRWRKKKILRRSDWEEATFADHRRYIVEVLKFRL
jgi:ParB-like chromosome segregation protein Spo0J